MDTTFITGFQTVFIAMVKITMIATVAGIMVKKTVITDKDVSALSKITVKLLLPCMIFSSMVTRFDPGEISWWWLLPLASTLMTIVGLIFARIIFNYRFDENRELVAMAGIQNSAYLILPIGKALFPENFDNFANLCFLFVMGNTPVLWCAGKHLISGKGGFRLVDFITPPLAASLTGVILVLLDLQIYIPQIAVESAQMMGKATIPMATFILGATLGQVSLKKIPSKVSLLKMATVKYICLPLITWIMLDMFNVQTKMPIVATLLMLQASAAPATGLILQARTYGGNIQKISGAMMVAYVCCIFAIPFWISIAAPV